MNDSIDDKILKLAEQLNDGTLSVDDLNNNDVDDSSNQQDLLAALVKINQVTNNIRQRSNDESRRFKKNDQWAHLKMINKIGQGGIGEVYCAHDPILNSKVAVKFLNQRSQLYITEQQFLDEARHMAKVRHPHVLAIHGATVDQGVAGYWSDFLNGDLLQDLIDKEALSWSQQLKYANQLCLAVKAIHTNQLVHGDIKAQNVMIQPVRGAILLDFGSSRSDRTVANVQYIQQASPMAMAPEQFAGKTANSATDVFALGLLFWHLSANHHPLQDLDLEAIKDKVKQLKHNPKTLSGPKPWKQLILQMVADEAKNRPDIQTVAKSIKQLVNRPARKAKQVALSAVLLLAFGITAISLFSNYKTSQAQQATEAMNTLLSDILMKSSPIEAGKDVLLVDVLTDAEHSLLNNLQISELQKTSSLMQLVRTYRHQGKHQKSIDLADKLLSNPALSDSNRIDLLMQKSAGLNENKNYQDSEALLLEAIKIKPITDQDATAQLSALTTLIYTYNESYQLHKVSPLIAQAKTLWQRSDKKEAALANIYLVEGNHYEIKEQYQKAYQLYQLAIKNFTLFYGEKNLDVLIAEGAAATVLTYDQETLEKGVVELQKVVDKMTDFLGKEHSSTLIARINLADAYSQTGNHQRAIDTIVPYMKFVEDAYGEAGGMTLVFKNMIAGFYQKNQDWDTALHELNHIKDRQTQKHGTTSEQAIEAQINIVLFYTETKQLENAQQMVGEVYQLAQTHLYTDHRLTLDVMELEIWIKHLNGNPLARDLMKALVQKKTTQLGSDDPSTLRATNRLNEML